ncbi:MAG TPA: hypothetical protein VN541_10045 [Tepidisphaeraceae bacterium]|nr:hypothetical protein [Tepidisphaeraceae bacterium]
MIASPFILASGDDLAVTIVLGVCAVLFAVIKRISSKQPRPKPPFAPTPIRYMPAVQPPKVGRPGGPMPGTPLVRRQQMAQARAVGQMPALPPLMRLAAQLPKGAQKRTARPQPKRIVAPAPLVPPPLPSSAPKPAASPVARIPASSLPPVARWLNSQTLRSQFILSEAMQPPLGLRTRSHLP